MDYGLVASLFLCPCFWNYTLYLPEQRTHRPITSQYPLETTIYIHSIHEQCAIGIFFPRLLLRQLLLKPLRIRFLNRSYPGTPPLWCRESRPYHEEPRLKTSFYPILFALAAVFLHCSPMVTLTSLPALSLQHTEVKLYSGRRSNGKHFHQIWILYDLPFWSMDLNGDGLDRRRNGQQRSVISLLEGRLYVNFPVGHKLLLKFVTSEHRNTAIETHTNKHSKCTEWVNCVTFWCLH